MLLAVYSDCFSQNTQFVNVFIGTDGTGHTFPGPSMPFGMVQPGPDNYDRGWNHTSGYQFQDSILMGFSQTRFSGTGINEMGDVLLLPFAEQTDETLKNRYFKDSESASVGYYSVLKKDQVKVELTCTERVAMHRYTYPNNEAKVLVDLRHGLRFIFDENPRQLVLDSEVELVDDHTIAGYGHTSNWVERKYFFTISFDHPFHELNTVSSDSDNASAFVLYFDLDASKSLQAKIALSTVSVDGATGNMDKELPGWDFDAVRKFNEATWNTYLEKIDIEADSRKQEIFYTSLYHMLLQPSNITDVDGQYRGADDLIAVAPNNEYYATLSIWYIYRGAWPLLQLLVPERIDGIVQTLLLHHKAAGFLPIWTAWGQDNYCMIGNHAIPMILSASTNGFRGFDKKEALNAMVITSTESHINSDWELYNHYGYYPFDKLDNEAVSRTLESGYDDWCVASMAEMLGDTTTAATFYRRAAYYTNLFDGETKLLRGKDTRGQWREPFDPLTATSPLNNPGDYTEANAWQYFWTPAQYDVEGMKQLLGGDKAFTEQLNTFFTMEAENPNKFLGQEAMIGQYAHGNEPSHHILYLYAFSNEPKTGQQYIHRVINEFHNNTPDGMIGNDDCGQMSAWYILSSLGFYPVNPANGEFVLGAPQISKATLHLNNGKTFIMEAHQLSDKNIYTSKVFLNGTPVEQPSITFQQIVDGGTLLFKMTDQ